MRSAGAFDWGHPDAVRAWPGRLRAELARLRESRQRPYDLAEAAPSTICHRDVWPMNLLAEPDGVVLLDWVFTGHGAIGEDIGNLIPDCVADGLMDAALPDITDACVTGYPAGLFRGRLHRIRRRGA